MNGTSKPNGYLWTDAAGGSGQSRYAVKHTFVEKAAANDDALLPAVCKQVNRNWTSGDSIVRTIDLFWLPGCDLMKNASPSYVTIAKYFLDSVNGLCEEQELNSHLSPSSINGCKGVYSRYVCWLRSAGAIDSIDVAALDFGNVNASAYVPGDDNGFSPACSIG